MNLGILGILMMVSLLVVILSKKVSPVIALIIVPIVFCIISGTAGDLAKFVSTGVKGVAETAAMFVFSIIFFGVLTDAGTFDPIVDRILKIAGSDPLKIVLGTSILAMIIHLDGSGVVTFMVTIPAMLPIYKKLGMRTMTLALATGLSAGVMNILPWGGPTLRAATGLNIDVMELYGPMIPAHCAGIAAMLVIAFLLGKKERAYVAANGAGGGQEVMTPEISEEKQRLARPKLFVVNLILILAAIVVMLTGVLSNAVTFMIAAAVTLMINYPNPKEQMARINAHAKEVILMVSVILAAGVMNGVLSGSGMADGITQLLLSIIPEDLGRLFPLLFGLVAVPLVYLLPMEGFFFGILPVLSAVAVNYGVAYEAIARASLSGFATVSFPLTPLAGAAVLLVNMCGLEWGDWQRKATPLAMVIGWVILGVLFITGVV